MNTDIRSGVDYRCITMNIDIRSGVDYRCITMNIDIRLGVDYIYGSYIFENDIFHNFFYKIIIINHYKFHFLSEKLTLRT